MAMKLRRVGAKEIRIICKRNITERFFGLFENMSGFGFQDLPKAWQIE
jgi:hypothetical protein